MCELIDKELNMWSCEAAELTYKQLRRVGTALGEEKPIQEFESFFDDESGKLIINKDNCNFDWIVRNYRKYLKAIPEKRAEYKEKHKDNEFYVELFEYLDIIADKIDNASIISLLGKQSCHFELGSLVDAIKIAYKDCSTDFFVLNSIYNYGLIQGKREERARRKKKAL